MQFKVTLARNVLTFAAPLSLGLLLLTGCGPGDSGKVAPDDPRVMKFTQGNFEGEVLTATQPVLVDFWAVWCGPCKKVAPIVAELAGEFEGRAKVGKVDVDAESELAQKYSISAIPTLLIFKDGKVVSQIVGARGKAELKRELEKVVGSAAPAPVTPRI